RAEAERACAEVEDALGLPCQDPIVMGVDRIADNLMRAFAPETDECATLKRA
ncbi:MAG: hypothetical protein JWN21_960, partial [Sphingomonas bacterium]|nr:hypothetical protein [Sphingomonas bacterium]